jgi:NADH-quinone oxidoreductase subunit M
VAAIAQKRPRRILALLTVSQSAFILAGLGSRNVEGITGSLVHWLVVAVATTGLVCILRAVEARRADAMAGDEHLGLAVRAPRLAVFFLVCGLALVGLPGTLGYCAEDLLFHGALASHPILGLCLLIATALNAIHLVRLYSQLFLGRRLEEVPTVPDAMSRERWALAACVVFLVAGGVLPGKMVGWRAASAERLMEAFKGAGEEH